MSTVEDVCKTSDEVGGEGDDDTRRLENLLEAFYSFMYEKAVLVGPKGTSPSKSKTKVGSPTRVSSPTHEAQRRQVGGWPSASSAQGSALGSSTTLTREIMDALLPPKTWQNDQGKWQRMVKMLPATRTETYQLQEAFDQLLGQYQARVHAICPVREKFFCRFLCVVVFHYFMTISAEELIREVACECPERGLVLVRVRDELRLTIEAHQTLYHNSIAYGRQKAVQAEAGVGEIEIVVCRLKTERDSLLAKRKELARKVMHHVCVKYLEEQTSEEEKKRQLRHSHTMQFLQTQRLELEFFYREMTQDPTWK